MSSGGHPVWLCSPFPGRRPPQHKDGRGSVPLRKLWGTPRYPWVAWWSRDPPSGEVGLGPPQPRASSTTAVSSVLRPHRPGAQRSSRQGGWEQPVAPAPGRGGRCVASTPSLVLALGTVPHTALCTLYPQDGCSCRGLSPAPGNSVGGGQGGEPTASATCRAPSLLLLFPRASGQTWTSSAPNPGREPVAPQTGLSSSLQWPP